MVIRQSQVPELITEITRGCYFACNALKTITGRISASPRKNGIVTVGNAYLGGYFAELQPQEAWV